MLKLLSIGRHVLEIKRQLLEGGSGEWFLVFVQGESF